MWLVRAVSRNKGFLIACGIAAWAGLEVGGKGTGVLKCLFSPGLTRDQGFHPLDLVGGRPKGPVRLRKAEAQAVDARLAKAFGAANVPKHDRTSSMQHLYALKDDAKCPRNSDDLKECNKVQRMEVFFAAVLGAMHPATEHVLWMELKSQERGPGRGEAMRVAVFLGPDEKVKLAFDLRRLKRSAEFKAFTVRAFDTSGLRDLAARGEGEGTLIVDDPGPLQSPRSSTARVMVYGGTDPPKNGIVSLDMEGDVVVRHKFFSAVLGKPVGGVDATVPGPAYVADLEPREEPFHIMTGVSMRQALIDGLGPSRAAGARFSRVAATAGRGSFYGLVVDRARHLAVEVTDTPDQQVYEFFWDGPGGQRPVASVTRFAQKEGRDREARTGPYHLIPVAEAGSAERLVVFRRGERGAAIAGLWPLAQRLAAMEPLIEGDAGALADTGVDMNLVRREARSDAWMTRCERFLSAYPSFEVKTSSDEWRRAACARGVTERRR